MLLLLLLGFDWGWVGIMSRGGSCGFLAVGFLLSIFLFGCVISSSVGRFLLELQWALEGFGGMGWSLNQYGDLGYYQHCQRSRGRMELGVGLNFELESVVASSFV